MILKILVAWFAVSVPVGMLVGRTLAGSRSNDELVPGVAPAGMPEVAERKAS